MWVLGEPRCSELQSHVSRLEKAISRLTSTDGQSVLVLQGPIGRSQCTAADNKAVVWMGRSQNTIIVLLHTQPLLLLPSTPGRVETVFEAAEVLFLAHRLYVVWGCYHALSWHGILMNMAFMSIYLSIPESFFYYKNCYCVFIHMICVRTHGSQHMGGQRTDIFLFHLYMVLGL